MGKKHYKVKLEKDGWSEPVFPSMQEYKMTCCDCGLVHKIRFSVFEVTKWLKKYADGTEGFEGKFLKARKYKVMMRVARDNRSTAAIRRWKK